jgi:hypothetical protein
VGGGWWFEEGYMLGLLGWGMGFCECILYCGLFINTLNIGLCKSVKYHSCAVYYSTYICENVPEY